MGIAFLSHARTRVCPVCDSVQPGLLHADLRFTDCGDRRAGLASAGHRKRTPIGCYQHLGAKARLDALKLQLNPHFLFNALNALGGLVGEQRAAEAQEMISRISTFLRNSLESISAHGEYRALEEELETVQAYLSIESVRFAERLDVRFECDEGLSTALVPAFSIAATSGERHQAHGRACLQPSHDRYLGCRLCQ